MPRLRFHRLPHAEGLPTPRSATSGSAGTDLRAAVAGSLSLPPGERTLIPTGLILEIPSGWEGQVRPRSGLALRHGLTVLNSPGTIDADYRGEVMVLLANLGSEPYLVERGDRIAQLVLARVETVEWEEVEAVETTERGDGGFGSSGVG